MLMTQQKLTPLSMVIRSSGASRDSATGVKRRGGGRGWEIIFKIDKESHKICTHRDRRQWLPPQTHFPTRKSSICSAPWGCSWRELFYPRQGSRLWLWWGWDCRRIRTWLLLWKSMEIATCVRSVMWVDITWVTKRAGNNGKTAFFNILWVRRIFEVISKFIA